MTEVNTLHAPGDASELVVLHILRAMTESSLKVLVLQALEFVREQLGFEHSSTLAAGDSGNDIDMLEGKNLAVVVGNAQAELLRWAHLLLNLTEATVGLIR